jgi:signal transduction histidine kinase
MMMDREESKQMAELVELLSSVNANADTAIRILNDLLNYDKIKGNGLTLDCDLLPLWSMVRQVTAGFLVQAKEKKIGIEFNMDLTLVDRLSSLVPGAGQAVGDSEASQVMQFSDTPEMLIRAENAKLQYLDSLVAWVDVLKLEQVTRNLISNALKFTHSGGIVRVTGKTGFM